MGKSGSRRRAEHPHVYAEGCTFAWVNTTSDQKSFDARPRSLATGELNAKRETLSREESKRLHQVARLLIKRDQARLNGPMGGEPWPQATNHRRRSLSAVCVFTKMRWWVHWGAWEPWACSSFRLTCYFRSAGQSQRRISRPTTRICMGSATIYRPLYKLTGRKNYVGSAICGKLATLNWLENSAKSKSVEAGRSGKNLRRLLIKKQCVIFR